MKKLFTVALLCLSCIGAAAQNYYDIEVITKNNQDKSVDFIAKKKPVGSFSVMILFGELQNTQAQRKFYGVVRTDEATLFKLKPENPDLGGIGYGYSCSFARGVVNAKPNTAFVYRLPYSVGKVTAGHSMNFIDNKLEESEAPQGSKPIMIHLEEGDTVFASRKGKVVEIVDTYEQGNYQNSVITFKSDVNHITIEHEDGTLAEYRVLKKGSITVREEDTVYPDTPLALAGTYGNDMYQVQLSVYYLAPDKKFSGKPGEKAFEYIYLDPLFATDKGIKRFEDNQPYGAVLTAEMISKEMSKREAKEKQK